MTFNAELGRPSTIEEELDALPDRVADALRDWKTKEAEKKHEYARIFLSFKANTVGMALTIEELKARVNNDAAYYQICLDCVVKESEYVRLNEKLMSAKKQASLRTAY